MEVPEPPNVRACSSCMSAIIWLYSARTGAWVSFATDSSDVRTLHVHACPDHGRDRLPTWRDWPSPWEPDPSRVDRVHRGAAKARAALAGNDLDASGDE